MQAITPATVSRYCTPHTLGKHLRTCSFGFFLILLSNPTTHAQIVDSITFFGSVDMVDDDFGSSGIQSGDEVIIDWYDIDLSRMADDTDDNAAYVDFAASSVQLSTFIQGSQGPDFFLDEYNTIGVNDTFFETASGNYFGDGADFSAQGPEAYVSYFFFNFSFEVPFSGPGGTDPSIPDNIATDPTPLQYITLLDSSLPNPMGNGQGDFSSEELSFSFYIDQVFFGTITGGDLLGDLNTDDTVDGDDFTIWNNTYASGNLTGDVDGDNDVDGTDFLIWQQNNGNSVPALGAVPESTSIAIALIGAALAACTRRLN